MRNGAEIKSNADMDDFDEVGNFYCPASATTQTLKNCPFKNAFTLKVIYATGVNYPAQIFKEFNTGRMAYRYYNSSGSVPSWQPYVYFSDDATIFVGTAILSGDDLNDYTTPGIYRATSSGVTATLLNMPEIFSSGFTMLVFNMSITTNIQVIFAGDKIYMRFSNAGGWQTWFKYSGTIISS